MRRNADQMAGLVEAQILVCSDPSFGLQAMAYEMGIREIWSPEIFESNFQTWVHARENPDMPESEAILLRMGNALVQKDLGEIEILTTLAQDLARNDFRIASSLGHLFLALGKHDEAEKNFNLSRSLNTKFFPPLSALGLISIQKANANKALEHFECLEKIYSRNPDRKSTMASALADLGRFEEMVPFIAAIESIDATHPRLLELKVRHALHMGQFNEAMGYLQKCSTMNDYFLSKINEEAIKLSKQNRTEDAVKLYNQAHLIAPASVRFKISYNIALAYRRVGDNQKCIQYLDRTDKECPVSPFDKSAKVRLQIAEEMSRK